MLRLPLSYDIRHNLGEQKSYDMGKTRERAELSLYSELESHGQYLSASPYLEQTTQERTIHPF